MQVNAASFEESVISHDTNSWKVRTFVVRKDQQQGDDLLSSDTPLHREENDLSQIYKVADFVCNNLSSPSRQWLKAKYQLMCTKSLLEEVKEQAQLAGEGIHRVPRERIKLLGEMLKPIA